MKKLLTTLLIFISGICFSQTVVTIIMNDVASTATGNYQFMSASGRRIGSIQISTNSAFNGSTTTAALQGSNDGTVWSTVFADDNTTPLSFTLSAGENSYVWVFKAVVFQRYRIVYTKGNATLGTVKAIMNVN